MSSGEEEAEQPRLSKRRSAKARARPKPSRQTVQVRDMTGKAARRVALPKVFRTPIRDDVVRKVVVALQSHRFQPQGRDPMAGKRTSAESVGVGRGLSRVPRRRDSIEAAFAPGTVGGRQAHPPVVGRRTWKRINSKEKLLALRSAIAATGRLDLVAGRGHDTANLKTLPLVAENALQSLSKTGEVVATLQRLGIWPDVLRVERNTKSRTGKARLRGRARRVGKGPLIVVEEDKGIGIAARNILGVDVVLARDLNVELLAPGAHLGRLTVWESEAFSSLDKRFLGVG